MGWRWTTNSIGGFLREASDSWRDLSIPIEFIADSVDIIKIADGSERSGRSYLYSIPTDRLSLTAEYFFESSHRDAAATAEEAFLRIRTHRVPLGVRFFSPSGVSWRLNAVAIDQTGVFFVGILPTAGSDRFWVVDSALEYRLPRRYGRLIFEVKNLFDKRFSFQDNDPGNPTIRPSRLALLRLILGR